MHTQQFSQLELDMLQEIVSMGANRGIGPMTKMLGERVDVAVPALTVVAMEEVAGQLGEATQGMTAVVVKIVGTAEGVILLLLTPKDAKRLVAQISQGKDGSALDEIVNILAGAALGALSRFLGLRLMQSVPGRATDMLRAVVNEIVSTFGSQTEEVLLIRMQFHARRSGIDGQLCFLFNPSATGTMLRAGRAKMAVTGGKHD